MAITKPMLACDLKGQWDKLVYPQYGTQKLDGIRTEKVERGVVSRTFKPIPNHDIRNTLMTILPDVATIGQSDGELICGNFQETTHRVMSQDEKTPGWRYYMFDLVREGFESEPYLARIENLKKWYETLSPEHQAIIQLVLPTKLNNKADVEAYEQSCLDQGFEGVILRSGTSPYKSGRSTLREQYLTKVKRFEDSEAIVVGYEELMNNNNVATKDNFGHSERSTHKDNLSGAGVLGAFLVRDIKTKKEFRIGSGFTMQQRKDYWEAKETLVGKLLKYKFFPVGQKDLPRHPIALGFRDPSDL